MKQFFAFILFILGTTSIMAQEQSPYSRFGLGQPYNNLVANLKAMGNISTAFQDSVQSNLDNPASLGYRKFSTLDFALSMNYRNQRDAISRDGFTEGGVSYVAYSFQVNKKQNWGMALGLKPLTYKKYDISTEFINERYFREFEGKGNTYKLYWQNGYAINEHFSLGVDASLYFGTLEDKTYNTFLNTSSNSSGRSYQQKLRGTAFKFGGQYANMLGEETKLVLGATYDLEATMNNKVTTDDFLFNVTNYDLIDGGQRINVIDRTVFNHKESEFDSDVTIPQKLSFGAYINKKQKWSLGLDGKFQNWKSFQNFNDDSQDLEYQNAYSLGLGGSFIPNYRRAKKAFEAFEYRYGGHYAQSYLNLSDVSIRDYGISLGVGLPIKRTLPGSRYREIPSSVDIAIDIGSMGTLENNLVQDNYIKGTIGLSLNDRWFQKKKYD